MRFRDVLSPSPNVLPATSGIDRRRLAWHAIALAAAAALAWLVFAAYRQPDLLLDLAAFQLC